MENRGFTLWFTGLSGAGKSTLAETVEKQIRARGRNVEVLDGDAVRTNLSKGLGFSKEDRDTNVRRIGYVAQLLTRNGVAVVTFVAMDLIPVPSFISWIANDDVLWWPQVIVMVLASMAGGLSGVKIARLLPTRVTRAVITTIGTVLTIAFFVTTY